MPNVAVGDATYGPFRDTVFAAAEQASREIEPPAEVRGLPWLPASEAGVLDRHPRFDYLVRETGRFETIASVRMGILDDSLKSVLADVARTVRESQGPVSGHTRPPAPGDPDRSDSRCVWFGPLPVLITIALVPMKLGYVVTVEAEYRIG